MLQLAEVLRTQPVQRGAVHFARAADKVVRLRLERRPVTVVPGIRRNVLPVNEHVAGVPVAQLLGQKVTAFQQQDPLARRGKGVRKRAPASPAPDHDDVELVGHDIPPWTRTCFSRGRHLDQLAVTGGTNIQTTGWRLAGPGPLRDLREAPNDSWLMAPGHRTMTLSGRSGSILSLRVTRCHIDLQVDSCHPRHST